MIKTPYKLDLILYTSYKSNNINKNNRDNKNNIYQTKEIIEKTKFINKLKIIIFNMGQSDIYYLEADTKTGFDFKIEVTNKNRINDKNYSEYVLCNGLLGSIKLGSHSELKKYIYLDSDELILQPIDYFIESEDIFINKWNEDKNKFNLNIPEIYFYGKITNDSGDLLSYYYITKKYYNYVDIITKNNFNFSITYFKKLLKLLDNLISRNYIYRNFNMFGLGFELKKNLEANIKEDNNNFEIIILGYTITTLLSLDDNFFNQFKISKCSDKKCIGNLTPYYVINDYYNLESNWLKRLNKFYSLGLVEIILILFYNDSEDLTKIYNFIIGPSIFESQLHYYHFYKRFNSYANINNLNSLISSLNLRYCNIYHLFDDKLKLIIINLLDKNYDIIYYPNHILNIIKEIQKADMEYKITYSSKKNIYNPTEDNYKKTDIIKKKKIIMEDDIIDNKDINIPIVILSNNKNYYNLYKKYKYKYLILKEKN